MGMRIGPLELQQDLTPADWVVDRIHELGTDVGSVVPEGFEAYVRLLHPAYRREGGAEVPVRWSEIARANGTMIHPEMEWPGISGMWEHTGQGSPGLWDHEPEDGSLPRQYATRLCELLAGYTSTPQQVWFCVWDGWGGLRVHPAGHGTAMLRRRRWTGRVADRIRSWRHVPRLEPPAPTLELPGRPYYLFSGPIEGIAESHSERPYFQSANLWWPQNREWFVATEIDFMWTYIGGSEALIERILDDPDLEAIPVQIGDTIHADPINPLPPRP